MMPNKKYIYVLFVLMILAQIFVPAQMIFHQKNILSVGTLLKFKTQPVDPSDPFRGKYISLNFEADEVDVLNKKDFTQDEKVYALLTTDSLGFAKIETLSKVKPTNSNLYLKVKINYFNYDNDNRVTVQLPFNRFYMNEHKAQKAEDLYRQSAQNTQNTTCAIVALLDGDAVIKDVLIDGIPIKEAVAAAQTGQKNKN